MLNNLLTIIAEAPFWNTAHLEEGERKGEEKISEVLNVLVRRILIRGST